MTELEQEIVNIIAEETGIDKNEIGLNSNLYDLGIDSLSSLEILVALENRYKIEIPENELKNLDGVKEIVLIVSEKLGKKGGR